jgi:hypothetical protein
MNKIHIYSTPRSGTHYLESLISGMLGIPILETPFEERNAFNISTKELSIAIDEFNAFGPIDSKVCKTHPNWLFPYDTSIDASSDTILVDKSKYCDKPDRDMLPLIKQFTEANDYTIGVIRLNITEAVLSFALAYHNYRLDKSKTGSFRPPYKNTTVTIPMEDFEQNCKKLLAIYEVMISQTLIQCDKIVYYEDLSFDSTDAKLLGLTPIHAIESSVKQAKSKKITIANYDELYEYAVKFFTANQQLHTMSIANGVITDINLTNLKKGK